MSFHWPDLPVDPHHASAFLVVMAGFAVTPGPANLFAIATGLERGAPSALLGVVGMNCATLVWFLLAASGLIALTQAYPLAFRVIAWLGAGYILFLGLKALWAAWHDGGSLGKSKPAALHRAWRDGFMVQATNPKAVLFFTAVLPPFIDPKRPLVPQLLIYALIVITLDAIFMSAYSLAGGALQRRFAERGFRRVFMGMVGCLLVVAAGIILFRH